MESMGITSGCCVSTENASSLEQRPCQDATIPSASPRNRGPEARVGGMTGDMSGDYFQDHYPDILAHCYGCGRLNPAGYRIGSRWDGAESVCRFLPGPEQMSIPGYVYGGLLASLIDCHGTGTAAGSAQRAARAAGATAVDDAEGPRYLTASLHVDYLK